MEAKIKMIWREVWKQPFVSVLFLLALLCVILRTVLLSVPEIFTGGADLGNVIYDLAIGYAAAWFFNLLVVILPRVRDRERIMEGAGLIIRRLCVIGAQMPSLLGLNSGDFANLAEANQLGEFRRKIQDIRLMDESSLVIYTPDGLRPALWHEWVVDKAKGATNRCQSLIPYFPYFESELIQLVNKVALSKFLELGRQLSVMEKPGGTMQVFAEPLAEFITACRELRTYYYTKVIMQDSSSDDGDEVAGQILIPEA